MDIRPRHPYAKVAKMSAVAGLVLTGLGATTTAPSGHFIAKTNTLNPSAYQSQPAPPLISESVVVQAPDAPEDPVATVAAPQIQAPVVVVRPRLVLASYGTGDPGLDAIARCESGGSYQAQNKSSTASGKYQYLDSSWGGYGGYSHAKDAPPSLQDQKAHQDYSRSGSRPWAASRGCWGR